MLFHGWLSCALLHACVASWLAVALPCFQACGASWLAVVLLLQVCGFMAGCRAPAFRWVGIFVASDRILHLGTQAGARTKPSVRRRSPLNGSLSGFFLIGYYSIFQLFKFSYRMLHAKVFSVENFIKTLFSINYRGYFIIQATHPTINYSYFYINRHKTHRKPIK